MKSRPRYHDRHRPLRCESLETRCLMTADTAAIVEAPFDAHDADVMMSHFGERAEYVPSGETATFVRPPRESVGKSRLRRHSDQR